MPAPVRSTPPLALAPGARVVIRDEEWIVHSVKPASWGGSAVHVTGTSELVRGKPAIFLSELDGIRELRPEETALVDDLSPQYRRSRLYLEALLRSSPPTDDALYLGQRAAIRPAGYQLQPAAKALRQLRPRILMADGVGLGKTIEVGVLLSELVRRGRGERILVVALKSVLAQFQRELWARFTIPLVRLDSIGIERVKSKIPSNQNPFYYFDRVIISMDTLKKDQKYRSYLEQCRWDAVVIDECQNVTATSTGSGIENKQRARLAQLLARTTDALILTSATPHNGKPQSFASLIDLIEPTAIADPDKYEAEDVRDYFLRRFKKDVIHEVDGEFCERKLELQQLTASPAEDAVFEALRSITFKTIARERGGKGALFRTVLLKAFLSSPAACAATIRRRLEHHAVRGAESAPGDAPSLALPREQKMLTGEGTLSTTRELDAAADREALRDLLARVEAVGPAQFSKLQEVIRLLRGLGFDHSGCRERVVIFSERIDTLEFLHEQLRKALKLKANQLEIFHGTLKDVDQARLVEQFGTEDSPIRILLASDAASEGINL
ncbi:MAG TPA: DEAD/DEAH box helicase, partial [Terriglobales bacterium]|nr:DEAD/DEAH box helicase [Terriglobales bacterium]